MFPTPFFEPYTLTPLDHVKLHLQMPFFGIFLLDNPSAGVAILSEGIDRLIKQLPFLAGNVVNMNKTGVPENVYQVQRPRGDFMQEHPMLKIKYHPQRCPERDVKRDANSISYNDTFTENFVPLQFGNSLFDPQPVLRFQANVMQNGIILCFSFHHRAMDGYGLGVVLETLAVCCRFREREVGIFPTEPGSQVYARRQIFEASTQNDSDYSELYGSSHLEKTLSSVSDSTISCIYTLDPQKVKQLRDACNLLAYLLLDEKQLESLKRKIRGHVKTSAMCCLFSQDDIVTSLIWLCGTRARNDLTSNSPSSCTSSLMRVVDVRTVLKPTLPRDYIGNAVAFTRSSFPMTRFHASQSVKKTYQEPELAEKFDEKDILLLFHLVCETRKSHRKIDNDHVRGLISHMMNQKDWSKYIFSSADVGVSSFRHAIFNRLDFGSLLGRFHDFDIPENRTEGFAWIKPACYRPSTEHDSDLNDAPWEIRWTLQRTAIEKLRKDKLFRSVSDISEMRF